jgi:hypothetical protein
MMAKLCGEKHQAGGVSLVLTCRKGSRCKKKTVDVVLNDDEGGQGINQKSTITWGLVVDST